MTQKKYQVFISSTYTDLIEERKKVQEILLMADCIPAGMEAFVAANDEQFDVIKKVIDLCDYYVLIIGKRYGSINQSTGLSYTEMEYDYALSQGIPVLVFAIDDGVKLSQEKTEPDEKIRQKLKLFKEKAMKNRLASIWKNQGDLAGEVAIAIMKAKNDIVRPGWVRGDDFNPEENLKKINKLQEENKVLSEKNIELQKLYDELMNFDDDLEFADSTLHIEYKKYAGTYTYSSDITFKEIFKYVSMFMIDVSVMASKVEDYIAQAIGAESSYYLCDKTIAKKIYNQFIALKLMCTKWVEDKGQFIGLTKKGVKLRNELNLIRKTK